MSKTNIRIVTLIDKNEDFIELQYNSIDKFIKSDVEYIVFNNGRTLENREKIKNICRKLNTRVISMPYDVIENFFGEPDPSGIVAMSLNIMWNDYLRDMDGLLLYMDSDMFFINELDIEKLGRKYDVGYIPQYRENKKIKYIWTGFFYLNMDTIEKNIDFNPRNSDKDRTDVGGNTSYFLKEKKYREQLFSFHTIEDISGDTIEGNLNGNCKEKVDIFDTTKTQYNKHREIIEKYNFPRPYLFDLIKIKNSEKPFIFHYKSANWNVVYGTGDNPYSIEKKNALRKMLNE